MVRIRLSRTGAKRRPFYHLVVTDGRKARDGKGLERLGFFNPIAKGQEERLRVDLARVDYWLGTGAQPSERAADLIDQARKAPQTATLPDAAEDAPVKKAAADEAE